MDLRGYGDSGKPQGGTDHAGYSKREMARDVVNLMATLGHHAFQVIGHDRGARVAHRLALDHPLAVERLAVFDIAPTATMYARTDKAFATRYFWWFFLIQPYPLPEKMIGSDPELFLRRHIAGQNKVAGATEDAAFEEYLRCYRDPATIHAICEDYRAAAGIDLEHDAADAESRVTAPLLALWARAASSDRPTTSFRRGARRRETCAGRPWTADTPCRRRCRTRCFVSWRIFWSAEGASRPPACRRLQCAISTGISVLAMMLLVAPPKIICLSRLCV